MLTKSSIEIASPRVEVFRWLTERDKLTAWMGGAGAMPEDPTQLKVGFSSDGKMVAPGGERATNLTITAWDPPAGYSCTITYPGGKSLSTYTLTETASGTRLELAGDTDWAAPDESAVDAAMKGQDAATVAMVRQYVEQAEVKLTHGDFDASTRDLMQKSVDDSLAKLKGLIEAATPDR